VALPAAPDSLWRLFANTWLVTALNPKGIVFFVAFLPQFITPGSAVAPQMWILAVTFVVMAIINAALYARFAAAAHHFLASARARRGFNLGGGSLLAGAGVWALLARRPVSERYVSGNAGDGILGGRRRYGDLAGGTKHGIRRRPGGTDTRCAAWGAECQRTQDVRRARLHAGGHMTIGIVGETLMARVGPARYADALALPHVRPMDFTGKPMKGYVYVDPPGIEDDAALEQLDHGLLGLCRHAAAEGEFRRRRLESNARRGACADQHPAQRKSPCMPCCRVIPFPP
jgi:uncharacterized membrane protein (DUF485 family)